MSRTVSESRGKGRRGADALHSFLADAQMQGGLQGAGVTSEPEVTFFTGGWAKTY